MGTLRRVGLKLRLGIGFGLLFVALMAAYGVTESRRHPFPDRRGVPIPSGSVLLSLRTEKDDPDPRMCPGWDDVGWEMTAPLPSPDAARDFYLTQMPRWGWRNEGWYAEPRTGTYRLNLSRDKGREKTLITIPRESRRDGVYVQVSTTRAKPWWQTIGGRP